MRGSVKDAILARVRDATNGGDSEEAAGSIPRDYRRETDVPDQVVLDLFCERVSDYRAKVVRVSARELPMAVANALDNLGSRRVAIPIDVPDEWLDSVPDEFLNLPRDGGATDGSPALSKGQLASCHGVVTGCSIGIAETGTIVLDSGAAQGRRCLSLLPDHHVCVVFEEQVVETVPQAIAALGDRDLPGSPLTFISGPSATSDIELVRVEGVHGPRQLEVILVGNAE